MISNAATRSRTRTRWGVLAGLAATALAAALWPVAPAHAGGDSGGVVAVFTHFEDDGSVAPSSIPCPGGQAVRGDATFGVEPGDTWHGTSVYDFCLVPGSTPNSFTFSGIETFTGTVDGCGTGTITYTVANGFAQLVPDPTAPNGFQSWTIVPGAGTGGLAGVTGGQGVGIFTIQQSLANEGFFAGFLVC
jgi:Protein of unknown function (DUF3224)